MSTTVNDIHSALNESVIGEEVGVTSLDEIRAAVSRAASEGTAVAIAGGRHAMGGQQFCDDGMLIDTRALDKVIGLDRERGVIGESPRSRRGLTVCRSEERSPQTCTAAGPR